MSSPPAPARHAAGGDAKARVQAPARPRSESRQRTALVAVRLLPQERDVLAETARSRGITLSELIRDSAMQAAGTPATEAELPLGRHGAKAAVPFIARLVAAGTDNVVPVSSPSGRRVSRAEHQATRRP